MPFEKFIVKKDIIPPIVEDIAIAAIPEINDSGSTEWNIYLFNLKDELIHNVLISSRGYGVIEKEKKETSVLRHFVEELPPKSFVKVEPIMEELFALNNQYWVSFYFRGKLYDKKYIFLAETIQEKNLSTLPLTELKGVLLR